MEKALIDAFVSALPHRPSPAGPGDDCAVLPPSSKRTCVTTDALVEGVHFTLPFFSLEDVGHKALAANLSDLAAMGATPTWWLASLGLPKGTTVKMVQQLAKGMLPLAKRTGLQLVGGNLTSSPQLTITLTLAGTAAKPTLRSTGKAGDTLFYAGWPGEAAAGLEVAAGRWSARGTHRARLLRAQRRPTPLLEHGRFAAKYANASMDVSDGLMLDIDTLAKASGVGAEIRSDFLPISRALDKVADWDAQQIALKGGEDYGLLFSIPYRNYFAFTKACSRARLDPMPTMVGRLVATPGLWVDEQPREAVGYDHFR